MKKWKVHLIRCTCIYLKRKFTRILLKPLLQMNWKEQRKRKKERSREELLGIATRRIHLYSPSADSQAQKNSFPQSEIQKEASRKITKGTPILPIPLFLKSQFSKPFFPKMKENLQTKIDPLLKIGNQKEEEAPL